MKFPPLSLIIALTLVVPISTVFAEEAPVAPSAPVVGGPGPAAPFGLRYRLLKDWTFGTDRPGATIRNRADLDREFYYRYIYDNGKLDTLSTYWSVHRDYPEDHPRNLHVIGADKLTLKGILREGKEGGLKKGGIESGMLRSKFNMTPGMYVEMRCRVPEGIGTWPAFWLNPGEQREDGTFSKLPWPPEIDIFEFFNWKGRPESKIFEANIQVNKKPEKYGKPHLIFSANPDPKSREYSFGHDYGKDFHVFALDWRKNEPTWYLDGVPIRKYYYEWPAPPAHILITNQLGMIMHGVDISEMKANEKDWDYEVDYIRVWENVQETP